MSKGSDTTLDSRPRVERPASKVGGGRPYLIPRAVRIDRGDAEPTYHALETDRPITFGRDEENRVILKLEAISRQHGKLSFHEGRWVYRDLGSRNGSYLSESMGRDETKEMVRLEPGFDHVVAVGQSVILANHMVCLSFLAELPGERRNTAVEKGSPTTRMLERDIQTYARMNQPLFILGAIGTGKTFVARRIHAASGLPGQFIPLNCCRLPRDVAALHSLLLGHVRGSYTGATGGRAGILLAADHGTLFLDDVESIPDEAQGFFLDLLDGSGIYAPYGAAPSPHNPVPKFRLISASNMSLEKTKLRSDFCGRITRGGILKMPTLEDRREDIPDLVARFVQRAAEERGIEIHFPDEAVRLLQAAEYRGQIRELEGIVTTVIEFEYSAAMYAGTPEIQTMQDGTEGEPVKLTALSVSVETLKRHLANRECVLGRPSSASVPPTTTGASVPAESLSAVIEPGASSPVPKHPRFLTADDLRDALEAHGGNITRTAAALGIAPNTLKKRLHDAGVSHGKSNQKEDPDPDRDPTGSSSP